MDAMDYVFKALADPTRRELLDRLKERDGQTLSELCEGLEQSRQSVTKHLNILEEVNLISVVWRGREKFHYLNPIPIREITRRWVSKYTKQRADALLDLKASVEEKPMKAKPEYNYVVFIDAPRDKVWEAMTKPEFTEKYVYGTRVESDWKKNGKIAFLNPDKSVAVAGEILKIDKPNELIYTFGIQYDPDLKKEKAAPVQFLLENVEGMTKLSVRHYDFQEGGRLFDVISTGWPVIISGMKTLLETGKSLELH